MSRLRRIEALEAQIRRKKAGRERLLNSTVDSVSGLALQVFDEATEPGHIRIGSGTIARRDGESGADLEDRVRALVATEVTQEGVPLSLSGFYRLRPRHVPCADASTPAPKDEATSYPSGSALP